MTIKAIIAIIAGLIATLTGGVFISDNIGAPPIEITASTRDGIIAEQEANFLSKGKYKHIPTERRDGKDVSVTEYVTPKGEAGYQILWKEEDGVHSEGFGPEAVDRTYTPPTVIATSTSSLLTPFLSLFTPLAHAFASNSHATSLESASSQYWSIAGGSQTGLNGAGDLTINAWVRPASQPASNTQWGIVWKNCDGSCSGNSSIYVLAYFNNGGTPQLRLELYGDPAYGSSEVNQTLSNDTIYMVTAVYDASAREIKLYVDGSQIGSTDTGNPNSRSTASTEFDIGLRAGNPEWDGDIDEVLFYDRELTDSDVNDLFTDPCNPSTTNLQGEWRFDNDGTDSTANGNNLTENNTPTYTTDALFSCAAPAVEGFNEVMIIQ